jgi:hypothetical protein
MAGLQDFLAAMRSGNIDVAKQVYSTMVPSSPSETMTMNSRTDELTEDKSPREWRKDAATGARQAGANRTGASAIAGDNPLGIGAVDINPLTAVPAAVADFQETREKVRTGESGPFEYGAMAAAIPLSMIPAAGGALGKGLAKAGKAVDKGVDTAVAQTRKLLWQDVPNSVRLPDELNIGQKLDLTNEGKYEADKFMVKDATQYGELDQQPYISAIRDPMGKEEAENAAKYVKQQFNMDTTMEPVVPEIRPEANPARSRDGKKYFHGTKNEAVPENPSMAYKVGDATVKFMDKAINKIIGEKNYDTTRDKIVAEGFTKGKSAELGDVGTSVSGDPTMSLQNFAGGKTYNMLVVEVDDAVKIQNTDPYTYLTRQHRKDNPEAVRKPNVFKEDETFFRQEGGGQQKLKARLPTEPEVNFMKRGSNKVYSSYAGNQNLIGDLIEDESDYIANLDNANPTGLPILPAKQIYNTIRDVLKSTSDLREFGKAKSTDIAYGNAQTLSRFVDNISGSTLDTFMSSLSPDARSRMAETLVAAKTVDVLLDTFGKTSASVKTGGVDLIDFDDNHKKIIKKILSIDPNFKGSYSLTKEAEKKLVNTLYSKLQQAKTAFLNSADKLSVALAAGTAATGAMSRDAEAQTKELFKEPTPKDKDTK